ncbi:M24 family metallopeptidase [Candidatus Neomarinimicrobiota bacterium]
MRIKLLFTLLIFGIVQMSGSQGSSTMPDVRRDRLIDLLPELLTEKGLDCWLTFTREGATDPLLPRLGSEHMVARAALVFANTPRGEYRRIAVAASYDVEPLSSSAIYDTVIAYESEGIGPHLRRVFDELAPEKIAVNISRDVPMADGITTGMLNYLEEVLPEYQGRFVSAEDLIISLFSRKLQVEIAAVREAAEKTQSLLREAFSNKIIKPGKSTELDVAAHLRRCAEQIGLEESCMSIVAGPARGHSEPTDRVIQRGDLVRADVCFKVNGYSSDIQRTAYILKKDERQAPEFVQQLWDDALAANQAALGVIKPGSTGKDVDTAARSLLKERGYEDYPHAAGHPIGLQVHDIGPLLAPDWPERYGKLGFFPLEPGMTIAVEPILYVNEPRLGGEINVGLEEDIVITESGCEVLGEPQTELWLVK